MAYLPNPQPCKNDCGAMIYFDKNSAVGHPEADKWIPLLYNEDSGVYTGEPHNCPKRPKYGNINGKTVPKTASNTDSNVTLQSLNQKLDQILSFLQEHTK